jgi:hypothetical protein
VTADPGEYWQYPTPVDPRSVDDADLTCGRCGFPEGICPCLIPRDEAPSSVGGALGRSLVDAREAYAGRLGQLFRDALEADRA